MLSTVIYAFFLLEGELSTVIYAFSSSKGSYLRLSIRYLQPYCHGGHAVASHMRLVRCHKAPYRCPIITRAFGINISWF